MTFFNAMFRRSLLKRYRLLRAKNPQTYFRYIVTTHRLRHFPFYYYLRKSQVCWFVPCVCLFVCLSVYKLEVTVLALSFSNFYSMLEMHVRQNDQILVRIRINFWIQDFFFTFVNIGVVGTFLHFHAQQSQISHENLQKIHTAAAIML